MARLSFALYEAHRQGASLDALSLALDLPIQFVSDRVEAARLCLLLTDDA